MRREDQGVLSEAEAERGDRPIYTYTEREEGWLYQALTIAADCRRQLLHASVDDHYGDLVKRRRAALASALLHIRNLERVKHPLDALLATMIEKEGL
jgi:hypothetical protein